MMEANQSMRSRLANCLPTWAPLVRSLGLARPQRRSRLLFGGLLSGLALAPNTVYISDFGVLPR
jgi:hypothetical protein